MSSPLSEALWWTVVFVVIGIVIAAGVRIVAWITEGIWDDQVWKAAAALILASAGGGTAITRITRGREPRR